MRTLAALTMITAVLLAGCTSKQVGMPFGTGPYPTPTLTTPSDGVKIGNPRKTGGKLNCAVITVGMVSAAVADPVDVNPSPAIPETCAFKIPKSAGPSGDGTIDLSLTNGTLWDKTEDLDGNSAAQLSTGTACDLMVALNKDMWLRVRMQLYTNPAKGDVCARSRTLAKSVMDALPPGTEGPVGQTAAPATGGIKAAPKKFPAAFDCAKLLPLAQVITAIGKPVGELTASCTVPIPSTEQGGTPGQVSLSHGSPLGTQTEFEGFTAYENKKDDGDCAYALVVADAAWVQVRVLMFDKDRGDVCLKARGVLKTVYEQLDNA